MLPAAYGARARRTHGEGQAGGSWLSPWSARSVAASKHYCGVDRRHLRAVERLADGPPQLASSPIRKARRGLGALRARCRRFIDPSSRGNSPPAPTAQGPATCRHGTTPVRSLSVITRPGARRREPSLPTATRRAGAQAGERRALPPRACGGPRGRQGGGVCVADTRLGGQGRRRLGWAGAAGHRGAGPALTPRGGWRGALSLTSFLEAPCVGEGGRAEREGHSSGSRARCGSGAAVAAVRRGSPLPFAGRAAGAPAAARPRSLRLRQQAGAGAGAGAWGGLRCGWPPPSRGLLWLRSSAAAHASSWSDDHAAVLHGVGRGRLVRLPSPRAPGQVRPHGESFQSVATVCSPSRQAAQGSSVLEAPLQLHVLLLPSGQTSNRPSADTCPRGLKQPPLLTMSTDEHVSAPNTPRKSGSLSKIRTASSARARIQSPGSLERVSNASNNSSGNFFSPNNIAHRTPSSQSTSSPGSVSSSVGLKSELDGDISSSRILSPSGSTMSLGLNDGYISPQGLPHVKLRKEVDGAQALGKFPQLLHQSNTATVKRSSNVPSTSQASQL
eukprot:scaffold1173_cov405-Prasinococcus_capsulatus_cf.AAC.8